MTTTRWSKPGPSGRGVSVVPGSGVPDAAAPAIAPASPPATPPTPRPAAVNPAARRKSRRDVRRLGPGGSAGLRGRHAPIVEAGSHAGTAWHDGAVDPSREPDDESPRDRERRIRADRATRHASPGDRGHPGDHVRRRSERRDASPCPTSSPTRRPARLPKRLRPSRPTG